MDLRNWEFYQDSSIALVGATVKVRDAVLTHPNTGTILATTTTNSDGMWSVTGLTDTAKDVEVVWGASNEYHKWYKGMTRHSVSLVLMADYGASAANTVLKAAGWGQIVNADVDPAAAIAYSKLNLASSIVSGDIVDGTIAIADLSQAALMSLLATANPIHNGGFTVWQRGSTFTSAADGQRGPDRWSYHKPSTTAVHDLLRSTDVPAVGALVPLTTYSVLLDCTTADASVAAGDLVLLRHTIEGFNWAPYAQKQFTIGFWVKATKTGVYCLSLKNAGTDRTYIGEYTVNVTDTWEFKTVTVPASPSAGTWDYTNGPGLYIDFTLMAGSTYQTTAGAWQSGGPYYGTSNQVNACDSASNNFRIWGVTMGLGTTVAPFWPRDFGQELALCQRYYQTSYPYGNTVPTSTVASIHPTNTNSIPTGQYMARVPLKPSMRVSPTVTIYPYTTVTNTGRVSNDAGTDQAASSGSTADISMHGFAVANQSGGTITLAQSMVFFGWQATADL